MLRSVKQAESGLRFCSTPIVSRSWTRFRSDSASRPADAGAGPIGREHPRQGHQLWRWFQIWTDSSWTGQTTTISSWRSFQRERVRAAPQDTWEGGNTSQDGDMLRKVCGGGRNPCRYRTSTAIKQTQHTCGFRLMRDKEVGNKKARRNKRNTLQIQDVLKKKQLFFLI